MKKSIRLTYLFQVVAIVLMLASAGFGWKSATGGYWTAVLIQAVAFWVNVWIFFVLAATRKKLKGIGQP